MGRPKKTPDPKPEPDNSQCCAGDENMARLASLEARVMALEGRPLTATHVVQEQQKASGMLVDAAIREICAYLVERDQLRPNGLYPRIARLAAGG